VIALLNRDLVRAAMCYRPAVTEMGAL